MEKRELAGSLGPPAGGGSIRDARAGFATRAGVVVVAGELMEGLAPLVDSLAQGETTEGAAVVPTSPQARRSPFGGLQAVRPTEIGPETFVGSGAQADKVKASEEMEEGHTANTISVAPEPETGCPDVTMGEQTLESSPVANPQEAQWLTLVELPPLESLGERSPRE
eukprot:Gb_06631 [translate_table: standard]